MKKSLLISSCLVLLWFQQYISHVNSQNPPAGKVASARLCENIDLSAFCVIDNHFKQLMYAEWPTTHMGTDFEYKYYTQFQEIVEKLFDENPWREDEDDNGWRTQDEGIQLLINVTTTTLPPIEQAKVIAEIVIPKIDIKASRTTSVQTFNDMCQLKNVLPRVTGGGSLPTQYVENPFSIEFSEIEVGGVRLHNHLHIKITSNPKKLIKYAFIVVNNEDGYAVGDFNTGVLCESDCNCKKGSSCHQGTLKDTVPCMYVADNVVTHPGQMMFYESKGVSEIHATWRFAQSTDPKFFTKELHFKTLLLEDDSDKTMERDCKIRYQFNNIIEQNKCALISSPTAKCEYSKRKGKFGWNAKYDILHPTAKTIGAWDYFRKGYIKRKDIKCHTLKLSKERFIRETYPTFNIDKNTLSTKKCENALNNFWDVAKEGLNGPQKLTGALNNLYGALSFRGSGIPNNDFTLKFTVTSAVIYFGVPDQVVTAIPNYIKPKPNQRISPVPTATDDLAKLPTKEEVAKAERCFCPRLGTAPPEAYKILPPKRQLEGRKDHVIQMTIAWIILIPLAIFVSRYYKETFSKVFFLQEYWWYTIHVLSLMLAMMFMFGGVYSIEVKREHFFNEKDPSQLWHAVLGGTAIGLFSCHIILGSFRLKKLTLRKIQICLHWLFGMLEWLFALAAMGAASFIVAGCMSCYALAVLGIFVAGQILFFLVMEAHMRYVDKKMQLKPKRKYMPPPMMRVFHTNAPNSRCRICVLCIYTVFCVACYVLIHISLIFTPYYESCFDPDKNDTAERYRILENQVVANLDADSAIAKTR